MPNWCTNNLIVEGKEQDVKKFVEDVKVEKSPLSFAKLVPVPDEIPRHPSPQYLSDEELNWRISNWGTKWDVNTYEDDEDMQFDLNEISNGIFEAVYTFDTAWTPCNKWLREVAPMYPNLKFVLEYTEEGMGIADIEIFNFKDED